MTGETEPRTLAQFPWVRVRVSCTWCPRRRGDYSLARLAERHGAGVSLDDLLRRLTATCPRPKPWGKRGPSQYLPWCRAVFTDLYEGRVRDP